jgi:hypothetical protein
MPCVALRSTTSAPASTTQLSFSNVDFIRLTSVYSEPFPNNVRTLIGIQAVKISRAADATAPLVQNVSINHRRPNVTVAKKFLHGTNVVPVGQQVCGNDCRNVWRETGFEEARYAQQTLTPALSQGEREKVRLTLEFSKRIERLLKMRVGQGG